MTYRPPYATKTCPTCGVEFSGPNVPNPATGRNHGKTCPNGHWNSTTDLNPRSKPALADFGVQRADDAVRMALVTMVECFERAVATLPEKSVARSMVVGAFGKAPEVSRKIIEVA